eukprot:2526576-Ditylum_brightwellii.AAC.1
MTPTSTTAHTPQTHPTRMKCLNSTIQMMTTQQIHHSSKMMRTRMRMLATMKIQLTSTKMDS